MNNRIKQVVLEMLRMGANPNEVLNMLSVATGDLGDAIEYRDEKSTGYLEYYLAIKDADFRP